MSPVPDDRFCVFAVRRVKKSPDEKAVGAKVKAEADTQPVYRMKPRTKEIADAVKKRR